ncbi:MAG: VanW family protein [Corynebacterium variabile]|nr:VanW family protein [Corynebacterium variabile]
MSDSTDETIRHPSRRGRRMVGIGLGGLAVVLAGGYLVGHLMTTDTLPARTEISGVAVGGLSSDQALQKARTDLAPTLSREVPIADGRTVVAVRPASAGLSVDWPATMAQVDPGNSWNPRVIWNTLHGGGRVPLVTAVDRTALDAAVTAASSRFAVSPRDAGVTLKGTRILTTGAVTGRTLDTAATAQTIADGWPTDSSEPMAATVIRKDPAITDKAVQQAVSSTLRPTVSGPVTVTTDKGDVAVSAEQIAAATSVRTAGGTVKVTTDMASLYRSTQAGRDRLGLTQGTDARILISGGKPTIRPSVDGRGISLAEFTRAIQPALVRTGAQRTGTAQITSVPARVSTEDARKAGVNRVIGEFTTQFPYAPYRNTNLTIAANTINNTYLAPGQTFSMDKVLGPRTADKGYVEGWVISGSVMKRESAGGISQSATPTFNAAFFAGMTDVAHHPHSLYFSRYPAGREATLYYGKLDLKFRNDTRYGVLVQAFTRKAPVDGSGSITVRIWSTPTWQWITSSELARSNYAYGRTVTSTDADCHPQSPSPGFDVNYSRLFWRDGAVARKENFFWRYDPTDEVVCR